MQSVQSDGLSESDQQRQRLLLDRFIRRQGMLMEPRRLSAPSADANRDKELRETSAAGGEDGARSTEQPGAGVPPEVLSESLPASWYVNDALTVGS